MSKRNLSNEKVLREYEIFLKEAKARAESTVNQARTAIRHLLDILDNMDLKKLNKMLLLKYKKTMREKAHAEEKKLSSVLKEIEKVKAFVLWLSRQNGFKKLNESDAAYLSLSKVEKSKLLGSPAKSFPTSKELELINSCAPRGTEVEKRNYIVFLLLMSVPLRVRALMTLPLKAFDMEQGIVMQDPRIGVKTKYSNSFISYIFDVIPGAKEEIKSWIEYLYKKGFTSKSPIIPKLKTNNLAGNIGFSGSTEVDDAFLKSPSVIMGILKELENAAGIKPYGAHAYRHALAKELLRRAETGEDLKMLSQGFGHKTIVELLKTYGNLDENDIIDVGKRFDDRLLEPATKSGFLS